jgi:hypothetical protein
MAEVRELEDVQAGVEQLHKRLEDAIAQYGHSEISSLKLLAVALNAWNDAHRENIPSEVNPVGRLIDLLLGKKKQTLLMQKGPEAFKKGDPIEREYNPNFWPGKPPSGFIGSPDDFILARTRSLLSLLEEASL